MTIRITLICLTLIAGVGTAVFICWKKWLKSKAQEVDKTPLESSSNVDDKKDEPIYSEPFYWEIESTNYNDT